MVRLEGAVVNQSRLAGERLIEPDRRAVRPPDVQAAPHGRVHLAGHANDPPLPLRPLHTVAQNGAALDAKGRVVVLLEDDRLLHTTPSHLRNLLRRGDGRAVLSGRILPCGLTRQEGMEPAILRLPRLPLRI